MTAVVKRSGRAVAVVVLVLIWACAAHAKGPQGVKYTWHNLGKTPGYNDASYYGSNSNEDEVCIYCHTPHGGTLNRPLWNRAMPDQSGANVFTHYNSATLSTVLQGLSANRSVNDESLACMSCHDGVMAVNRVLNASNRTGSQPTINGGDEPIIFLAFTPGIGNVIGDAPDAAGWAQGLSRDLSDDHPISFSYYDVITGDAAAAAKLRTVAQAEAAGVRFFPEYTAESAGNKRVECSSCHDPHVNYDPWDSGTGDQSYTPFLIKSNAASALCLACHIK